MFAVSLLFSLLEKLTIKCKIGLIWSSKFAVFVLKNKNVLKQSTQDFAMAINFFVYRFFKAGEGGLGEGGLF